MSSKFLNCLKTSKGKIQIAEWIDMNGRWLSSAFSFNPENFTKIFNLDGSSPVDLEATRRRGAHRNYSEGEENNKLILFISPKRFEFETLLKTSLLLGVETLYDTMVRRNQPVNEERKREFNLIIEKLKSSDDNESEESINLCVRQALESHILEILIKFNDLNMVINYMRSIEPNMSAESSAQFAKIVAMFGYDALKEDLNKIVTPSTEFLIPNCQFILVILIILSF